MTTYVFSLGLIPVQEWIAEARRSRDLRAGSAFLCHLMARILRELRRQRNVEIVLPVEPESATFDLLAGSLGAALDAPYGIPNRASGYCEAASDQEVKASFESAVEEGIGAGWAELKRVLQAAPKDPDAKGFWEEIAGPLDRYLRATAHGEDCPFAAVWVAAPAEHPRTDRRANLLQIDRLYSEVKRSRPLRPWPSALSGPAGKCNQCGRREAVGPTGSFEQWRRWHEELGAKVPWLRRGFRIDRGERLCYVCLAKRMAAYERSRTPFPSTGEVAARPWRARAAADPQLASLIEKLAATPLGHEDLTLALRAPVRQLAERGAEDAIRLREQIRTRIDRINELAAREKPGRPFLSAVPPGYLALLAFDGDDMGRRVREDPDLVPGAMHDFAVGARRLLADHDAEPFYLAGDEGLAMAPAASALELAMALRQAFARTFAAALGDDRARPTMSAGMALFEHSRPMAGAIRSARAALERAKALPGKDALGVTVQTASGNLWPLEGHWSGFFWERLRVAASLVREGHLATGWAHDAESFLQSIPADAWRRAGLAAAVRDEVKRLFFRRLSLRSLAPPKARAAERRRLREEIWCQRLYGDSWWEEPAGDAPRPLPEQFHLIAFLARQGATVASEGVEEAA
jgi:CRISPR-associated protein Cmr2